MGRLFLSFFLLALIALQASTFATPVGTEPSTTAPDTSPDYEQTYAQVTNLISTPRSRDNVDHRRLKPVFDFLQGVFNELVLAVASIDPEHTTFSLSTPIGQDIAQIIYDEYKRQRDPFASDELPNDTKIALRGAFRSRTDKNDPNLFRLSWFIRPPYFEIAPKFISSRNEKKFVLLLDAIDDDMKAFFAPNSIFRPKIDVHFTVASVDILGKIIGDLYKKHHHSYATAAVYQLSAKVLSRFSRGHVEIERKLHDFAVANRAIENWMLAPPPTTTT